jgi:hypothetical protein
LEILWVVKDYWPRSLTSKPTAVRYFSSSLFAAMSPTTEPTKAHWMPEISMPYTVKRKPDQRISAIPTSVSDTAMTAMMLRSFAEYFSSSLARIELPRR